MAEYNIKLNPDDEDDRDKLYMIQYGWLFRCVLHDIDQHLRGRLKYEELSEEVHTALQKVRDLLWDEVREHNLEMD